MTRLLLVALLAGGCSASNGAANSSAYCTPPACAVGAMTLAVAVTPAVSAPSDASPLGIARLDLAQLTLDENGFFQLQLAAPVLLTGQVSVGKAGVPAGISGSVVANRPSRILGRPDETYQAQLDLKTGQYTLPVTETLPGESYTVRVLPRDTSQYPPQTFQVPPQTFQVPAQAVAGAPRVVGFDLVLDDPTTLTQIKGTITDPVGKAIPGLQVQVIDPTSKEVVSTTAVTDAGGGYALLLSKSVQRVVPAMVLLTATPTMDSPAGTPLLELPVSVGKTSVSANLKAPPLPTTAQFSYQVTGLAASGADEPIVGAQLTFVALVSGASSNVTAVFQARAQSDSDGVVTVGLIPGAGQSNRNYQVSVTPPSSSDFQALVFDSLHPLAVGPTPQGGFGMNIQLSARPRLSGRVVDQDGRPLAGVTVQPGPATVQSALDARSFAGVSNAASTATAADGRFTLAVDSATYDLGLLPPATLKLPRRFIEALEVAGDRDVGDLLLPPAALVRGQLLDPRGNLLANADVQVYSVSSMEACPSRDLHCVAPPELVAEGTSSTDGRVQVLLPAATAGLP